ncbi:MAG: CopG family transcriptional regulator [Gammaproteobacteria bacterium]
MGQVTIYVDDDTEQRLKSAAAAAKMPVSRWVATLVKEKTLTQWPDTVRELPGTWDDFPRAEELRQQTGADIPREPY